MVYCGPLWNWKRQGIWESTPNDFYEGLFAEAKRSDEEIDEQEV